MPLGALIVNMLNNNFLFVMFCWERGGVGGGGGEIIIMEKKKRIVLFFVLYILIISGEYFTIRPYLHMCFF